MMKAALSLAMFGLFSTASARWTGNVMVVNLMTNHTLEFINCSAEGKKGDASSTILVKPSHITKPQEIARFAHLLSASSPGPQRGS